MKYREFIRKISKINAQVVLLEGKRKVREEDRDKKIGSSYNKQWSKIEDK